MLKSRLGTVLTPRVHCNPPFQRGFINLYPFGDLPLGGKSVGRSGCSSPKEVKDTLLRPRAAIGDGSAARTRKLPEAHRTLSYTPPALQPEVSSTLRTDFSRSPGSLHCDLIAFQKWPPTFSDPLRFRGVALPFYSAAVFATLRPHSFKLQVCNSRPFQNGSSLLKRY